MAREDLHFRLRIPEGLKARIEQAAEQHQRSMTAEIVARLTDTFEKWPEEFAELIRLAHEQGAELDEARKKLREAGVDQLRSDNARLTQELEQLRLELAHERGKNAALLQGIGIFTEHLLRSSEGSPVSLDQILHDINRMRPSSGDPQ